MVNKYSQVAWGGGRWKRSWVVAAAALAAATSASAKTKRSIYRLNDCLDSVMSEERKTVIVGQSKPILNYVTACITMFNGGAQKVVLRARGEAINMSVDVAQMLKKRFMSNVQISNITIDGESVTSKDGRQLNLPVIEIELSVPQ